MLFRRLTRSQLRRMSAISSALAVILIVVLAVTAKENSSNANESAGSFRKGVTVCSNLVDIAVADGSAEDNVPIDPGEGDNVSPDSDEVEESLRLPVPDRRKLKNIIDSITDPEQTQVEKIKAVHDWMVRHIQYDLEFKQHSASDTLNNGVAVCSGYSALFYEFMTSMGIRCVELNGTVIDSTNPYSLHAWNAVQLEDGVWYFVDVCWDDPIMNGTSDYPYGDNISYTYFLCGRTTVEKERFLNGLPDGTVSDEDYDWEAHVTASCWVQARDKWRYRQDGRLIRNQWLKLDGDWYFLDSDAYMVTGWRQIQGQYYYFHQNGVMAANETLYFDNVPYVFDDKGNYYMDV